MSVDIREGRENPNYILPDDLVREYNAPETCDWCHMNPPLMEIPFTGLCPECSKTAKNVIVNSMYQLHKYEHIQQHPNQ